MPTKQTTNSQMENRVPAKRKSMANTQMESRTAARKSKATTQTVNPSSAKRKSTATSQMKNVMPTIQKSTGPQDAFELLRADHVRVKSMFKEFEKFKGAKGHDEEKAALVEKICLELNIHSQVEEEIFYPAVRAAIHDDELMDEADVEHAGAKELISQLQDMHPGDDHYDAKVTVLGENVDHHVKEEQDEMFPKAKKAKLDAIALGARITQRSKELHSHSTEAPRKTRSRMLDAAHRL